ncbi:serine/threonine-protein kinase [Corallococcus exercitus]|uniref:non-specific serine/threonine protein kinase n=1 Tax=Corallococcus exercitus TaxID=2316736 RepID=A0A7Y4JNM9_9BACT|nr:serine/threonine-protein kinase [Corallococcus exercitus]NOK08073.1 serine/threonine protein kinase [Corallococcus exercitus]
MAHPSNPPLSSGVVLFTQGDTSYEFFRDLGAGRLGERVLLAFVRTPQGLGDCVVLKGIPLPQGEELSEGFQLTRTRLEEEVRLARYLQHPRIARVHGLVEMTHGLCVVMENLEGLSLNTLLSVAQARGRYFSESFVLYVGAEVAAALDYAHTRTDEAGLPLGIVNRDVNPGRIRLGPRGEVRMTDFGVALSRLTGRVATSFPRPQGEVLYAAPEALMGDAVDARGDLFSLGLTLLEFATGRHLYDPGHLLADGVEARLTREEREKVLAASVASLGLTLPPFAEDIIRCAMSYRSEDVERAAEGLPVPLRDILHTLLRRAPAERFATAAELEAVMRARLAQLGPYTCEDAVKEVQWALVEAGDRLWDLEVPEDEGGITPPVTEDAHADELSTETKPSSDSRSAATSARHPDEVTTAPGEGPRRAVKKPPA